VIAAGEGYPCERNEQGELEGVEAVIDKDLGSPAGRKSRGRCFYYFYGN